MIGDLNKKNGYLKIKLFLLILILKIVNIKDIYYVIWCCDGVKDIVNDEYLIDFWKDKIETKKDEDKISQLIDIIYHEKILEDNKIEIYTINNNNKNKVGKDNMAFIIIKIKRNRKTKKKRKKKKERRRKEEIRRRKYT